MQLLLCWVICMLCVNLRTPLWCHLQWPCLSRACRALRRHHCRCQHSSLKTVLYDRSSTRTTSAVSALYTPPDELGHWHCKWLDSNCHDWHVNHVVEGLMHGSWGCHTSRQFRWPGNTVADETTTRLQRSLITRVSGSAASGVWVDDTLGISGISR